VAQQAAALLAGKHRGPDAEPAAEACCRSKLGDSPGKPVQDWIAYIMRFRQRFDSSLRSATGVDADDFSTLAAAFSEGRLRNALL